MKGISNNSRNRIIEIPIRWWYKSIGTFTETTLPNVEIENGLALALSGTYVLVDDGS